MGLFIFKPLLYCYILTLCQSEPVSEPHILNKRYVVTATSGYLTINYLSMKFLNKFGIKAVATGSYLFHPIHVSTSNIEYNSKDNKIEVICTLFTDDFEAGLAKQYHTKTDLEKADMHAAMDALIKQYLTANLKINADNAPVKLNYVGYEINREATDVYLESDKLPPVKKVDVDASLLYNLFDDEINIVHIVVNGVRKSEKVNYPDRRVEQVF